MKSAVWLMLLLTACIGDDAGHPQVIPGAGGHVNPAGGGTTGTVFIGRVCRRTDLLDFDVCTFVDVSDLTVRVASTTSVTTAVTDVDGTFSMTLPQFPTTPTTVVTVSGLGAVTTTTPFTPDLATLPVIDADVFARSLASNFITLPPNTGSILGRVLRTGTPATGVTVISTPSSAVQPLFDSPAGFSLNETGARGVFFIPGISAPSNAALTFSPGETLVGGIPVINGGVTILDSTVLPP